MHDTPNQVPYINMSQTETVCIVCSMLRQIRVCFFSICYRGSHCPILLRQKKQLFIESERDQRRECLQLGDENIYFHIEKVAPAQKRRSDPFPPAATSSAPVPSTEAECHITPRSGASVAVACPNSPVAKACSYKRV